VGATPEGLTESHPALAASPAHVEKIVDIGGRKRENFQAFPNGNPVDASCQFQARKEPFPHVERHSHCPREGMNPPGTETRSWRAIGPTGKYSRLRGISDKACMALLCQHMANEKNRGLHLMDFAQVLPAYSPRKIQRLLNALAKGMKIRVEGRTKGAKWYLIDFGLNNRLSLPNMPASSPQEALFPGRSVLELTAD
jgi:hypothetical protein